MPMEDVVFLAWVFSVLSFWVILFYSFGQVKKEAKLIAHHYSVLWGINSNEIPLQNTEPTKPSLFVIIVSFVPGINLLYVYFLYLGMKKMKKAMWGYMEQIDRQGD